MNVYISAITESQGRVLHEAILDLMLEAEASAVILCDRGGNILSNTSWAGEEQVDTVAALASGSFAATQELAAMTGEREFTSVSHEGHASSIHIQSVARDFLLVVQFNKTTTLGLVKLYTEKTSQKIQSLLMALTQQSAANAQTTRPRFEFDQDAPVFAFTDEVRA